MRVFKNNFGKGKSETMKGFIDKINDKFEKSYFVPEERKIIGGDVYSYITNSIRDLYDVYKINNNSYSLVKAIGAIKKRDPKLWKTNLMQMLYTKAFYRLSEGILLSVKPCLNATGIFDPTEEDVEEWVDEIYQSIIGMSIKNVCEIAEIPDSHFGCLLDLPEDKYTDEMLDVFRELISLYMEEPLVIGSWAGIPEDGWSPSRFNFIGKLSRMALDKHVSDIETYIERENKIKGFR